MKRVKATAEEKRNGWTDASLNHYRLERERASFMKILIKPPVRPSVQNHKYNPLKWRRQ